MPMPTVVYGTEYRGLTLYYYVTIKDKIRVNFKKKLYDSNLYINVKLTQLKEKETPIIIISCFHKTRMCSII